MVNWEEEEGKLYGYLTNMKVCNIEKLLVECNANGEEFSICQICFNLPGIDDIKLFIEWSDSHEKATDEAEQHIEEWLLNAGLRIDYA